jgi:hypothetical protein
MSKSVMSKSTKSKTRRIVAVTIAVMIALVGMCPASHALSVKTQKGNAVAHYSTKNYKKVKGPSWAYVKQPKYKWWNAGDNRQLYYKSSKSTKGFSAKFQRWLMMEMANPQSMTISPDGNNLFIIMSEKTSAKKDYKRKGYIVKVDLKGLKSDKEAQDRLASGQCLDIYVCSNGSKPHKPEPPEVEYKWVNAKGQDFEDIRYDLEEQALEADEELDRQERQRVRTELETAHPEYTFYEDGYDDEEWNYHSYDEHFTSAVDYDDSSKPYASNFDWKTWCKNNGFEYKKFIYDYDALYRKYIKVSGQMLVGHGQTLAYNPKTNKLWYFPTMKRKACKAVMVNPTTLKQEAAINFKMKSSIQCPSTLTFDMNGNAYCYARARGGWGGKNVAKIYKGTITPNKVSFRLVMSGVNPAPGERV